MPFLASARPETSPPSGMSFCSDPELVEGERAVNIQSFRVIVVVKNMFRFEPFIRSWKGVSLFEVRALNIS
jgi:hypothetical protein